MAILTALVIAVLVVWRIVVEFRRAGRSVRESSSAGQVWQGPDRSLDAGVAFFVFLKIATEHLPEQRGDAVITIEDGEDSGDGSGSLDSGMVV